MASVMHTACEMTETQERMEQEARGAKAKTFLIENLVLADKNNRGVTLRVVCKGCGRDWDWGLWIWTG